MLKRIWKHITTTSFAHHKVFPHETMLAIEDAITKSEKLHRGEICFAFENALPVSLILKNVTPRNRAMEIFARYGVWDTEENTGVLVYICIADQAIEIVADRGLDKLITQETWDEICSQLSLRYAQKNFRQPTLEAIDKITEQLKTHFPAKGEYVNELPNKPIIL